MKESDLHLVQKVENVSSALKKRDFQKVYNLLDLKKKDALQPSAIFAALENQKVPASLIRPLYFDLTKLAGSSAPLLEDLGNRWFRLNCFQEAERCYEQVLSTQPSRLGSILGLVSCLFVFSRYGEARQLLEAARLVKPSEPRILTMLARVYLQHSETEEALVSLQLAEELGGKHARKDGMLFVQSLAYLPDVTGEDLKEAGEEWEMTYARPVDKQPLRKIDSRIRVGYYSPDLRNHSVAYFLRPIFREYDRSKFEVFVYSDTRATDHVTKEFHEYTNHWRDLIDKSDKEVVQLMKKDELHLLIDCTGYFGESRPWIFASRPAPVQAHLIGYNGTTGLSSLDYRFSDSICDPPSYASQSSEQVVALEDGFLCFNQEPELADLGEGSVPCIEAGFLTFGCFNNPVKLNDEVIEVWVRILKEIPQSRLLLKLGAEEDLASNERMRARFESFGLQNDQLKLIPRRLSKKEHIEDHRLIDIVLDPFPVNGTTTTFESLWMGVPVITLQGGRHSARVTSSILECVGLAEGITQSKEEYIDRAIEWAKSPEQLQIWRKSLRTQLSDSPMGDSVGYTRRLEAAYREITSP